MGKRKSTAHGVTGLVERGRRGLRRYGPVGAARRSLGIAREAVYARSEHVWYELVLDDDRPRPVLDGALTLLRADRSQLPLLDELWAIDRAEAERRLANEGTLWLAVEGVVPAFSCWTFRKRTPVRAAPGGSLGLPPDTVCLEESMTAAGFRGRGVAPAVWAAIADRLQGSARRMVTTVERENTASRRAVEKAGFREIARMTAVKIGPRYSVAAAHDTDATAFLAAVERRATG
ncbi:MAG TPA: GNAT family N-acetyltransferase [Gaiellaceae bacterium]